MCPTQSRRRLYTILPVISILASIPSPSSGVWEVGPLTIRLYGIMLLLGIAAATWIAGVRWTRWGGDWDLMFRTAMWGVAGGIVGARLYHVVTSWSEVPDPKWQGVFELWRGGLGIWGGIAGGVLVGGWVVHRAGESMLRMMDAVAPGLLVAQAVGRLGNYFNQELFGTPTDLPWGLEIDPENRPARYLEEPTFHPLFLYESLWNLLGAAVLVLLHRRVAIRPPGVFCLYVAWYTFGRTFLELIRTDPAHEFLGLRLNVYVSIGVFLVAVAAFVWTQRRPGPDPPLPGRAARGGAVRARR